MLQQYPSRISATKYLVHNNKTKFIFIFHLFIIFIYSKDLLISTSNKDSFPLESGIFKYVLIKLKGVKLNF